MVDDQGKNSGLFEDIRKNFEAEDNKILDYELISFHTEEKFEEGKKRILDEEYDIIILDLRDKGESELELPKSGMEILAEIKKLEFVPVIFYTGAPQHIEISLNTDLIRVVEKEKGFEGLLEEIENILNSNSFKIKKQINSISKEILREYLWEFVYERWEDFTDVEPETLKHIIIKRFSNKLYHESLNEEKTIHPILFYQYPQINKEIFETGTILKKGEEYFVVITPSCDISNNKVEKIILLRCFYLEQNKKYKKLERKLSNLLVEIETNPDKESELKQARLDLNNFLGSNGNTSSKEFILPKTFFLPGFYLNFQHIHTYTKEEINQFDNVGKINSPFVQKLIDKFSSSYSRVGTPDINFH